jgi:hypothetical protein
MSVNPWLKAGVAESNGGGPRLQWNARLLQSVVAGRGLHSSTFQLNLSALYGIGGARRGCVARVKWVLGGV